MKPSSGPPATPVPLCDIQAQYRALKEQIDAAVLRVLERGHRTRDIHSAGTKLVGTTEMGDLIVSEVEKSY